MATSRLALACALLAAPVAARPETSTEKGSCQFANEPLFPGYFWDPNCEAGVEGCFADGKNVECRFCGGGDYSTPCPASSCHFPGGDPFVPYYWDPDCQMGMLGCWADGIHRQCRYCGDYPYTSIECPERRSAAPPSAACTFFDKTETPHFWDPSCKEGMLGCLADGIHTNCRFCGAGAYTEIQCPAKQVCSFANEPTVPYYWDPQCAMGKLGCNADGVHVQCRFCAIRPFEDIPCPEEIAPPKNKCIWPLGGTPKMPHYWEPKCIAGVLGCWADGLHAECRFCGEGVFENITCQAATEPDAHAPPHPLTPASLAAQTIEETAAAAVAGGGRVQGAAAQLANAYDTPTAAGPVVTELSSARRGARDVAAGALACVAALVAARA